MNPNEKLPKFQLKVLETPAELAAVEELQALVWPGDAREIVPAHLLIAATHHGGLLIGAYAIEDSAGTALLGFVFGFPGFYPTADGPRLMHISHMLAVRPESRSQGLGFLLKRAQWQIVRNQQIDRIVWTYDPLLSRNAHLNIARLGAVCNVYLPNYYGEMRDGLNTGLPSDRFQVDWWVNGDRARRRLSRQARTPLKLDDFLQAEVATINPTQLNASGFPEPGGIVSPTDDPHCHPLALAEIPADFQALKAADPALAAAWRQHSRDLFETYFAAGFLVTDLLYQPGAPDRSFYVLTHGESTL